ncbi:MAG TPA: flagellar hook protein FlgE [Gallionella sp.]|nr:flagellar hook protein FlgE [Gallionella sp.]
MSFQQGLSGLNLSAKQLDVIGNNVANSGTVGFKQSQAQFSDMYAASLSGSGAVQIGTGGKIAAVVQQFTQGNITNTSNPMDTAISGHGFFRMIDPSGSILYSRNGQFQVDKNGFIVNNQGHKVSGYLPNAAGTIIPGQPLPIQLNSADLAPKQTAGVVVGANLDARAATPVNPVFSTLDPTSYNSSTSMTVYDSLGANHVGSLYFQRQSVAPTSSAAIIPLGATTATLASTAGMAVGNTITLPGAGAAGPATTAVGAGTVTTVTVASAAGLALGDNITIGALGTTTITGIAGNVLTFAPALAAAVGGEAITSTKALTTTITGIVGNVVTFAPATTTATLAAASVTSNAGSANWNTYLAVDGVLVPAAGTPLTQLTFNTLGQLTAPVGPPVGQVASAAFTPMGAAAQTLAFNFAQTSQYGGNFGVNSLTQDGYSSGRLSGFTTSADGTILGRYTNGQSRALGQMLLANFTNPQGLQPMGNNEWVESSTSGGPLIGTPGSSSLGVLQSSATEDSNVDLTAELVNMIVAQRVYQANAQTIKTQDAVLQTLVSMR